MKICIPVTESNGMKSSVSAHFGSAPFFVIADTETTEHTVVENKNEHEHGQCGSFPVISSNNVQAILCNGMGRRALENLNRTSVKAFIPEVICATAQDALSAFINKKCRELMPEAACSHGHDNDHGKGCNH